jgi:hypothetical protein
MTEKTFCRIDSFSGNVGRICVSAKGAVSLRSLGQRPRI